MLIFLYALKEIPLFPHGYCHKTRLCRVNAGLVYYLNDCGVMIFQPVQNKKSKPPARMKNNPTKVFFLILAVSYALLYTIFAAVS